MAVENVKSTAITNANATPSVPNNPYLMGGLMRTSVGKAIIADVADVASTYRLVRVPASARIVGMRLTSDASGATGTVDIGIYKTARDGGAVVSVALFANAKDLFTAALADAFISVAPENKEKRLWELAGLTADPGIDYDITLTSDQAFDADCDVALEVTWVQ